jgi:hypothetical protein
LNTFFVFFLLKKKSREQYFLAEDPVSQSAMAAAVRSSLSHLARLSAAPARGVVRRLLGPEYVCVGCAV